MANLTAKSVEKLRPGASRREVKDDATRGLYLRIETSGRKSWRYRYSLNGRTRILSLGAWPEVTLSKARARASQHAEAIREGDDPAVEAQRAAAARRRMPTVEDFVEEYIERYAKPRKKTWGPDEGMLRKWIVPKLGSYKMDQVSRRDIVAILDEIHDAGLSRQPGKVLAVTRRMFRFAVERGVLDNSPVQYITERQPAPARKAMTLDMAREWWEKTGEALEAEAPPIHRSVSHALRLLLLTGQRPGEVAGIHRDDLELEGADPVWTIPGDKRKHGKPHAVALTHESVAVIRAALKLSSNEWLFPNRAGDGPLRPEVPGRALRDLFGARSPTAHAARHTVATELEGLGFDEMEVARVLGHQSQTITGRVYINRRSLAVQRRALEAWERHLFNAGGAEILSLGEAAS